MPEIMHYRMNHANIFFDDEYPQGDNHVPHSPRMEPRKLLLELMNRAGDNSNSLAVKLKFAVKQPQIYKFMHGQVQEPKRSNIEPIAAHYGVPVDAFYDPELAEIEYAKLMGTTPPTYTANYLTGKPYTPPQQWRHQAEAPEDEAPPMDSRTRAMMVEAMVEDRLYECIAPGWDIIRERNRWADLTVVNQDGNAAFDVEVKMMRLRGRRVDQIHLEAAIGRLWMASHQRGAADGYTPTNHPHALVLVLTNDENQFEANAELFRSLNDCTEAGLLAAYTVLGLEVDGYHVSFVPVQTSYKWPTISADIEQMVKNLS